MQVESLLNKQGGAIGSNRAVLGNFCTAQPATHA